MGNTKMTKAKKNSNSTKGEKNTMSKNVTTIDYENVLVTRKMVEATENININEERTKITASQVSYEVLSYYDKDSNGKAGKFINNKKNVVSSAPLEIPLKEISLADVKKLRQLERADKLSNHFFLFVEYPKYYFAIIPENMTFLVTGIYDDVHLCRDCKHMSARPTCDGGCQKVIDIYKSLENYPYITIGYQTMGPGAPSDKVVCICECSHYEANEPRDIQHGPKFVAWRKNMHNSLEALFRECF